jgi:hypothetical protein
MTYFARGMEPRMLCEISRRRGRLHDTNGLTSRQGLNRRSPAHGVGGFMTHSQSRIERLERRAPKYRDYVPLVTGRRHFIGPGFCRIRPLHYRTFTSTRRYAAARP